MIVQDCVLQWREMEGDSHKIQKLNSLYTSVFVERFEVPSDECLSEAKMAMDYYLAGGEWKDLLFEYLIERFAENDDGTLISKAMEEACRSVTDRTERILKTGWWPDRPTPVE